MVEALQSEGNKDIPERVLNTKEDTIEEKNLQDFVTSNTTRFFNILGMDSHFLDADPETWHQYDGYLSAEETAKSIIVTNDSADRRVALIEEYNTLHTCDEEQKQYLLLAVSEHRRRYPDFKKSTLVRLHHQNEQIWLLHYYN